MTYIVDVGWRISPSNQSGCVSHADVKGCTLSETPHALGLLVNSHVPMLFGLLPTWAVAKIGFTNVAVVKTVLSYWNMIFFKDKSHQIIFQCFQTSCLNSHPPPKRLFTGLHVVSSHPPISIFLSFRLLVFSALSYSFIFHLLPSLSSSLASFVVLSLSCAGSSICSQWASGTVPN